MHSLYSLSECVGHESDFRGERGKGRELPPPPSRVVVHRVAPCLITGPALERRASRSACASAACSFVSLFRSRDARCFFWLVLPISLSRKRERKNDSPSKIPSLSLSSQGETCFSFFSLRDGPSLSLKKEWARAHARAAVVERLYLALSVCLSQETHPGDWIQLERERETCEKERK